MVVGGRRFVVSPTLPDETRKTMRRLLGALWARLAPDFEAEQAKTERFGAFEAGVLVVAAVGLTLMQFGGGEDVFLRLMGDTLLQRMGPVDPDTPPLFLLRSHPWYELLGLAHWVGLCVLGYVLLPSLFLVNAGHRVRDVYLGFEGFRSHIRVYLALYLAVMLPVVMVSFSPEYQRIYPFYTRAGRSWFDLLAWELLYGLQFFGLEFFFRGFLLAGLRRWLGYGAVFVMVVPYCMLHFQKTWTESLGAIVAGIILGSLAMRYRSIWGGVMVHWMVAISMDLLSLMHQGTIPQRFWPG